MLLYIYIYLSYSNLMALSGFKIYHNLLLGLFLYIKIHVS